MMSFGFCCRRRVVVAVVGFSEFARNAVEPKGIWTRAAAVGMIFAFLLPLIGPTLFSFFFFFLGSLLGNFI